MFSKAFAALVAALLVSFQQKGMVAAQLEDVEQGDMGLDMEAFKSLTDLAKEDGLLASDTDAVVIGDKMELGLGHINLTDEEILAGNPALVSFLDILEDDDKFAKWEREKVPGLLLEIQSSSKKTNKKQKQWARKAVAASEMSVCERKNNWKQAAYSACRRWGSNWYDKWICKKWGCHGDDNHVMGLCHRSCKGWSDDGSRCWKQCGSITTTPTTCGNAYCSEDSTACANHVINIVFSIAQMLSNLIPQKALVTLGGRVAKGVSKAVLKAALKEFAKSIVKNLVKKTKRKVKKFIRSEVKGQIRYLKDELVEELISEAAEAFAIDRAKKQMNKRDFPDIEEVAAAIDPIGVTDVIEAFSKPSCDQSELGAFPSCPTKFSHVSYGFVVLMADEECCYGYGFPYRERVLKSQLWSVNCNDSPNEQASVSSAQDTNTTTDGGAEDWVYTDDDFKIDPSSEVDVIRQDLPLPMDDIILCQQCADHASCKDNEVEGANLTAFDMCTTKGCCGPAPEGYEVTDDDGGEASVDIMPPMENLIADIQDSNFLSASQEDFCDTCASFSLCLSPTAYAICNDQGCCDGFDDPEDPEWIPPPINTSNQTESDPSPPMN